MITHTKKEILDILKRHQYLVSFLQKKRLFFKFIIYCMNPKWDTDVDYINKPYLMEEIISYSFLFRSTKEGYVFWSRINDQYVEYYLSNIEL